MTELLSPRDGVRYAWDEPHLAPPAVTVEAEVCYEIRLHWTCGCVETWPVGLPPHPDDVEVVSPLPCPSMTTCPVCERDGKCEARR